VTILDEAARVTAEDRQRYYGHPLDNHGNTAAFWSSFLKRRHGLHVELTPEDVCMMMVLLKVSRWANLPHEDALIDIAGYARNVQMIEEERDRIDLCQSSP
jgi:hypothetical protein